MHVSRSNEPLKIENGDEYEQHVLIQANDVTLAGEPDADSDAHRQLSVA
jgi:hypothetical protein